MIVSLTIEVEYIILYIKKKSGCFVNNRSILHLLVVLFKQYGCLECFSIWSIPKKFVLIKI